jgi:hypothetical protein
MLKCKTFGLTLIAFLFVAALSAAPAFAVEATTPQAQPAAGAAAALPSTCGLNLPSLDKTAPGETCAAQPQSEIPDFFATSARLGYCHCGCVNKRTCHNSDDCGGASCDPYISCC